MVVRGVLQQYIWTSILIVELVHGYVSLNSSADSDTENFNQSHLKCNETMDYSVQYCHVESSLQRNCLVQRSHLLKNEHCRLWGENRYGHECWYYEVCVFSTPKAIEWLCGYQCDVENFAFVRCNKTEDFSSFLTPCHRAFIHCPRDKRCRRGIEGAKYLLALFQEGGECKGNMTNDSPLYWINQAHYDGESKGFGHLSLVRPSNRTLQEMCTNKTSPVIFSIVVIFVFIAATTLVYGYWKYKKFFRILHPQNNPDDPIYLILSSITSNDNTADEENMYQDNMLGESFEPITTIRNSVPVNRKSKNSDCINDPLPESKEVAQHEEAQCAHHVLPSTQSDAFKISNDSYINENCIDDDCRMK